MLTDYNNLKYFISMKNLSDYQVHITEQLSQYDFDIEYKPGLINPSDPLSWRLDYARGYEEISGKHVSLNAVLPTLQQKLRVVSLRGDSLGTTLPTLRETCETHVNVLHSSANELSAQVNHIHTDYQYLFKDLGSKSSKQNAESLNEHTNSMRCIYLIAKSK
jgi:hypothetical protein